MFELRQRKCSLKSTRADHDIPRLFTGYLLEPQPQVREETLSGFHLKDEPSCERIANTVLLH